MCGGNFGTSLEGEGTGWEIYPTRRGLGTSLKGSGGQAPGGEHDTL